MKKYQLAEFFAGCGGFSRGFINSGRFDAILANDIKKEALATYSLNHANKGGSPVIIEQDIRKIPLLEIKEMAFDQNDELDCLVGGPPCQGFSQMRRSEEREKGKIVKFRGYSKLAHDPRNDLVLRFLEIAESLMPKFIVIENVPQMLNHGFEGRLGRLAETITDMLHEMGYSVAVGVLNAADYGVPQLRNRAVILASRVGPANFPEPSHVDPDSSSFLKKGKKPWVTVGEALRDLPDPAEGVDALGNGSLNLYKKANSEFAKLMQSKMHFPYNHISRTYKDSVLSIIKDMRSGETWDAASERNKTKYEKLIARMMEQGVSRPTAKRRLISEGKINPVFYQKYYWSAYTRLEWDHPALTITANANFLGSGRFTHPEEMRGITMREAARLQSFDDDFKFVTSAGDFTDTARIGIGMDMIGEAVPPLMAQAIASHIAAQLDACSNQQNDLRISIRA